MIDLKIEARGVIDNYDAGFEMGQFIDSFEDFEQKVKMFQINNPNKKLLFRGQQYSSWTLLPKVFRGYENIDTSKLERRMLEYFKNLVANSKFSKSCNDDWEYLALAQHYGMKTRFLDWTTDHNTALWFACVDEFNHKLNDVNSTVYVYATDKKDYADTDNASPFEVGSYKIYQPRCDLFNDRLQAQLGWFTVHSLNEKVGKVIECNKHSQVALNMIKMYIHYETRSDMINNLTQMGINYSSIYPDLIGICQEVEWKFKNHTS